MTDGKFWLSIWSVVMIFIVAVTSIGVYSGHLDDQRDLEMAKNGLHKYKVERCNSVAITEEWHEAGWENK